MTKTGIVPTLLCAALLLSFAPAGARAQTQEQPKAAPEARRLTPEPAPERPTLKALFSESVFKIRSSRAAETDFKRLDTRWQQEPAPAQAQTEPERKRKMTIREKLLVFGIAGFFGGVCVWAIANPGDDPLPPSCFDEPSNPNCISDF